jgi:hypothetical protein
VRIPVKLFFPVNPLFRVLENLTQLVDKKIHQKIVAYTYLPRRIDNMAFFKKWNQLHMSHELGKQDACGEVDTSWIGFRKPFQNRVFIRTTNWFKAEKSFNITIGSELSTCV